MRSDSGCFFFCCTRSSSDSSLSDFSDSDDEDDEDEDDDDDEDDEEDDNLLSSLRFPADFWDDFEDFVEPDFELVFELVDFAESLEASSSERSILLDL